MAKVEELTAQLKEERLKSLELETVVQNANITKTQREKVRAQTCWAFSAALDSFHGDHYGQEV